MNLLFFTLLSNLNNNCGRDTCGVCDGKGEMVWFADRDGDGLGDSKTFIRSCDEPLASE